MTTTRYCINPRCQELLLRRTIAPLCPSCRLTGHVGLFVGAVLAGAVTWLLR